jgi:hypothetical protein
MPGLYQIPVDLDRVAPVFAHGPAVPRGTAGPLFVLIGQLRPFPSSGDRHQRQLGR